MTEKNPFKRGENHSLSNSKIIKTYELVSEKNKGGKQRAWLIIILFIFW